MITANLKSKILSAGTFLLCKLSQASQIAQLTSARDKRILSGLGSENYVSRTVWIDKAVCN